METVKEAVELFLPIWFDSMDRRQYTCNILLSSTRTPTLLASVHVVRFELLRNRCMKHFRSSLVFDAMESWQVRSKHIRKSEKDATR